MRELCNQIKLGKRHGRWNVRPLSHRGSNVRRLTGKDLSTCRWTAKTYEWNRIECEGQHKQLPMWRPIITKIVLYKIWNINENSFMWSFWYQALFHSTPTCHAFTRTFKQEEIYENKTVEMSLNWFNQPAWILLNVRFPSLSPPAPSLKENWGPTQEIEDKKEASDKDRVI